MRRDAYVFWHCMCPGLLRGFVCWLDEQNHIRADKGRTAGFVAKRICDLHDRLITEENR
jgi:hypothetical protein